MEKLIDLARSVHIKKLVVQQNLRDLRKDEDGAALVEYTVLLGILLVGVIVTIGLVGTWISGRWTALNTALPT
jgi:pilus assembly protein Flp/PilA